MSNPTPPAIQHTINWVRQVVIACNLCPFAAKVDANDQIYYVVSEATTIQAALESFLLECKRLDSCHDIETTLLIYPHTFQKFDDYLHFLALAEQLIQQAHYTGIYQVASFHPEYKFANADSEDPANFTNRSPYPMLHILREASLEKALQHYPNSEQIPKRNIAFAHEKGLAYMKQLRDACLH